MNLKKNINTDYLIIGAGVSSFSFASCLEGKDYIIVEKEKTVGGYCKTFKKGEFTWDYAGHFFHFKRDNIQSEFSDLLNDSSTVYNNKNTKIYYKGKYIDYPFQFNIDQLDKEEFIDCLYDLFNDKKSDGTDNFKSMLYYKFGEAISNKFLIPYNEKLYACDLDDLDVNAMGRFFPTADPYEIVKSFRGNRIKTYNDEFFYSKNGAIAFLNVLREKIDEDRILTSEEVYEIDYKNRVAYTPDYQINYKRLINTMPFDRLLKVTGVQPQEEYTANKVLVINMGFDKESIDKNIHWIYYPEKSFVFYRVGFYNNILNEQHLSIYVEIGLNRNDEVDKNYYLNKVLCDLKKARVISDHNLVDYNMLIMDPAYVHISKKSQIEKEKIKDYFEKYGLNTIGRYGNWTYCSLEDCIYQAQTLYKTLEETSYGADKTIV